MKKTFAILSSISLLLSSSYAFAASGYANPTSQGLNNLFLVYTGYSMNGDGTSEEQHWETKDFQPIITHMNRKTNRADGEMFSNFLFTAGAIQNSFGQIKYISQAGDGPHEKQIIHKFSENGSRWAYPTDWHAYLEELFNGNHPSNIPQNIDALYDASLHNKLNHALNIGVWIALPYADPKIFVSDQQRAASLEDWIDTFILAWKAKGYASNFQLKGFYWIGESVDHSNNLDDAKLIKTINQYIHNKTVNLENFSDIWIPYEGATDWNQWKQLGFDVSFLQPNYYFSPYKTMQKGAQDAYNTNQGLEIEMDLGVTWDYQPDGYRSRFISYLNQGATGGTIPSASSFSKQAFPPFMPPASALAWYTGGWWWTDNKRDQSIEHLYRTSDPLYDNIYEFLQGKYKPTDK